MPVYARAIVRGVWRALALVVISQVLLAGVLGRCARAQRHRVVFIAPAGLAPDTASTLADAIATQVSLAGAELVYLQADRPEAALEERMRDAESLAETHRAAGVFWMDTRPSGRWFLYITDHTGEHVVVRPLAVEDASVDAAIEAAAVIAGSATDALLKQRPLEGELVPAARVPPPPVPEPELRLELAYTRALFSPQRWVDGIAVGGSWLWPSGPYLGLMYLWSPPIQVYDEVDFEVTRHPIWLHGGARVSVVPRVQVGVELAFGVEVRQRVTTRANFDLDTGPRTDTRPVWMTAVRLAVEWRITEWLAILGRASPELALDTFDYAKDTGNAENPEVYLSAYQLRFTGMLGIAIIR